jgi:hypothetical protein
MLLVLGLPLVAGELISKLRSPNPRQPMTISASQRNTAPHIRSPLYPAWFHHAVKLEKMVPVVRWLVVAVA